MGPLVGERVHLSGQYRVHSSGRAFSSSFLSGLLLAITDCLKYINPEDGCRWLVYRRSSLCCPIPTVRTGLGGHVCSDPSSTPNDHLRSPMEKRLVGFGRGDGPGSSLGEVLVDWGRPS